MTGLSLLFLAGLATAHFAIQYPYWRADTLMSKSYSQWTYPCANVSSTASTPVTEWPLSGGSLILDLHHSWTYIAINLGLGHNVGLFNVSLTNPFWNETGNGTLCVDKLMMPADLTVKDGDPASLQVITFGADGASLYNCADIVFRANVTPLADNACFTSPNVKYAPIKL